MRIGLTMTRKYRKNHQPLKEKKTLGNKITTTLLDLFTYQDQ